MKMKITSFLSDLTGDTSDALWPNRLTTAVHEIVHSYCPFQDEETYFLDAEEVWEPIGPAPRLVLCSSSPRRRKLMELSGWPFEVKPTDMDEKRLEEQVLEVSNGLTVRTVAAQVVLALATSKAGVAMINDEEPRTAGGAVYIGADTIVLTPEQIYGKPTSLEEARSMLISLSGQAHHVLTAVCLIRVDANGNVIGQDTRISESSVHFNDLDETQLSLIDAYIKSGSSLDKAGGYGIQDHGALLIKGIEGDFYTIMGLPISSIYRRLQPLMGAGDHSMDN